MCKQHSISLMNTALTRALIQLAQNKRWKGPADGMCGRKAPAAPDLSPFFVVYQQKTHKRVQTRLCYWISAYCVTFVLLITPTLTFSTSGWAFIFLKTKISWTIVLVIFILESSSYSNTKIQTDTLAWGNYNELYGMLSPWLTSRKTINKIEFVLSTQIL